MKTSAILHHFSREKIFTSFSCFHSQKLCLIIVGVLNAKLLFENTGYLNKATELQRNKLYAFSEI